MSIGQLSAVLLTGGESTRMGSDKAMMDFRGKPLWQNQLAVLNALNPIEIFISARTDPPWRPRETIFVADAKPSIGPLGGIVATLRKMSGSHLLVLAIDLPLMTTQYLRNLSDQAAPGSGVVPVIANRAEPLAAIYPGEAEDFAEALGGRDHSLQSVVARLADKNQVLLSPVLPEYQRLFQNVNSPADLESLSG